MNLFFQGGRIPALSTTCTGVQPENRSNKDIHRYLGIVSLEISNRLAKPDQKSLFCLLKKASKLQPSIAQPSI